MLVQTRKHPAATSTDSAGSGEFSTKPAGQSDPSPEPETSGEHHQADLAASNAAAEPACVNTWVSRSKYRKQMKSLKKTNIYQVFNYSSTVLTEPMLKVLERGLSFSVLPLKLNLTQVLVDFRRFERTMLWKDFWSTQQCEVQDKPIFKIRKSNFPKNHKTPNGLKTYLSSCKSEILDPKNRNKAEPNLPKDELNAIKELIQLQKERIITIKPCDKGAGIIVLNFEEYSKAATEHLNSKHENENYYEKVDHWRLMEAQRKINDVLDEALEENIISKQYYNEMKTEDKTAGKFYCTFKVHKTHEKGTTPPVRPIVSGVGSVTENIGVFVEHHLKEAATQHTTYLKDTPDFLRKVENEINSKDPLPQNAIIVTCDVTGLYTNIPQDECTETARNVLNERTDTNVPTDFIIKLLELILKYNIFEFGDQLFQQIIGFAMGSRPAPACANIFMAEKIDPNIVNIARKWGEMKFFKRFLDDLLSIFIGTTKNLHKFYEEINRIHPNIKFTMEHTTPQNEAPEDKCSCPEKECIQFLDTSCSIEKGKVLFDLYRKPTDQNKYLLPDSCHPPSVTANIPFSLFLRITRICSTEKLKEKRFQELREMLLERKYPKGVIEAAMIRAQGISRQEALRPMAKPTTLQRPLWVVSWDPRLPDLQAITNKHWRTMTTQDEHLKQTFPEPPMVAFKRQKNLRDYLIRAKLPNKTVRNKRILPGMKRCPKTCATCPYVQETKEVKSGNVIWKINRPLNCQSTNVIYMIKCRKDTCQQIYIGETERTLNNRFQDHKGYVTNNSESTYWRTFQF